MPSILVPRLYYQQECETIVQRRKNYCFTTPEGWASNPLNGEPAKQLAQIDICKLCAAKNKELIDILVKQRIRGSTGRRATSFQ